MSPSLALLLLAGINACWATIPIGETHGDFQPSTWGAAPKPVPAQPEGRAFGGARLKHGYGHQKPSHHKVDLGVDPEKIILKCKVHEPLEHIIWIRSKCPNDQYDGGHLVAEGATVQDKTLYDVRILGGNSTITSELQLKRPLDPAVSGFFRCEAWPHGGGGPPYGQNVAQDVYVIGGPDMLRRCFGGWDDSSSSSHPSYDSWNVKHRSSNNDEPTITPPPPMQTPQSMPNVYRPGSYSHNQNHYSAPSYKSDMRTSESHKTQEVVSRVSQQATQQQHYQHQQEQKNLQKKQHEQHYQPYNSRPTLLTSSGYKYSPAQSQMRVTAAPDVPATSTLIPSTTTAAPAELPPRNYIAAPFIPSPVLKEHHSHTKTEEPIKANDEKSAQKNATNSDVWNIEQLMSGDYPFGQNNRRGKAVEAKVEEKLIIVTPLPQVR